MPFPTPKGYFIQGVGKLGTQQHIGWAWYHQPLLAHVLYCFSSEASDVPISGYCREIQYTDPLQNQPRIFRHNVVTCLGRIKPCIISVTRYEKIVVFTGCFPLKREQIISIENHKHKSSTWVPQRCRQPWTLGKLKLGFQVFAITCVKLDFDHINAICVNYCEVVHCLPRIRTWLSLVSKVND